MTASFEAIRSRLAQLREHDLPTHGGRTLAYVYDSGRADLDALAGEALAAYGGSNGLDPSAFPSLAAMQRDLLALGAELLHAPHGYAGAVTSGGTESCLLAVLAAREGARAGTGVGQIVAPSTVHAAFHRAAHLFGLHLVLVDVDPSTHRADPAELTAALTEDTVLVVVSAPSYAHGVVDPVTPIAAAAAQRGIRCHVDACIGGWVLPFLDEPDCPGWDFRVPGVTSVSVDLHKYGYAPKGVSLLLHRDAALRRGHIFATADWPGYGVVNPTLQSTRSGGPIAAAWAVTQALGRSGYAALAAQARAATVAVAAAVDAGRVPGLQVLARPDSTLLALAASPPPPGSEAALDVYTVCDELLARGWYAQPQLPFRGGPASLHLSFSAATEPIVGQLVEALTQSAAAARAAGPVPVDPHLAGVLAALDPGALDEQTLGMLLAAAGLAAGADAGSGHGATGAGSSAGAISLPARMAPIHALLASCPAPLRAALLGAVVERL